jgi:hypothetical protein
MPRRRIAPLPIRRLPKIRAVLAREAALLLPAHSGCAARSEIGGAGPFSSSETPLSRDRMGYPEEAISNTRSSAPNVLSLALHERTSGDAERAVA